MFTVKLMTGQPGQIVKIIEAREVEVRHIEFGPSSSADYAVVVKPGPEGSDDFWHYVGWGNSQGPSDNWACVIIENAAGKTTEVVRANAAPHPIAGKAA